MIRTIAETIDAQRTGVLAGAHAHPGGNCDGRNHALQPSVDSEVHQAAQVYQSLIAEDYFWGSAIQSEHADFHVVKVALSECLYHSNDTPSMDSGTATPR